jgi:hypothetical protein
VKIHIRFLFYLPFALLALCNHSCQKKEVLQAEDPTPTDTSKPIICPDCEFPDTVWKNSSLAPQLRFKLKFDSTQTRLNDQGQVSLPSQGIGAQSPSLTGMSINYIELMPEAGTAPGAGVLLYKTAETTCGGAKASNFCKGTVVAENALVFSVDLAKIPPGTYSWIRISIAYQEFNIQARTLSSGNAPACFAGFSSDLTYLSKIKLQNTVVTPTLGGIGNKTRGYWLFYQQIFNTASQLDGQAPHTTVVNSNPQATNSGTLSYVYGQFTNSANSSVQALVINANETSNKEIILSISTNKSFEWTEITKDGLFQPEIGESVLDFGCRGLIPFF